MPAPFVQHGSEYVLDTPIFRMRRDRASHPATGHTGSYYVLESPDWVNIVALTEDRQIVMVRQWRHGTRSIELEIPAGLVDHNESPIETAARELREETGYEARSLRIVGRVAPNAAYQNNTCTTVLAEGCRPLHSTQFDPGEDLELVLTPLAELPGLLETGQLRNGMVIAGIFWWLQDSSKISWLACYPRTHRDRHASPYPCFPCAAGAPAGARVAGPQPAGGGAAHPFSRARRRASPPGRPGCGRRLDQLRRTPQVRRLILAPLQIVVGYPFLARRFRRIPLCDAGAVEQACERAHELSGEDRLLEPAAIFFAFAERRGAFPFARRLMAAHLAMTQARVSGLSLDASHDDLGTLFTEIAQRRRGWPEVRAWFEPRLKGR